MAMRRANSTREEEEVGVVVVSVGDVNVDEDEDDDGVRRAHEHIVSEHALGTLAQADRHSQERPLRQQQQPSYNRQSRRSLSADACRAGRCSGHRDGHGPAPSAAWFAPAISDLPSDATVQTTPPMPMAPTAIATATGGSDRRNVRPAFGRYGSIDPSADPNASSVCTAAEWPYGIAHCRGPPAMGRRRRRRVGNGR